MSRSMKSRGQSKPTKTRKREEEEGAGEKWSESLIDKLRSYRSLRRHPLPFPFFRREAINLHSSSSYRFRKRPGRDGVRSTCDRDRRKWLEFHLHPLATATRRPVRRVDASRAHQRWRRLFAQSWLFLQKNFLS